ncbi:hypothetical protein KOM00_16840 [Geomonas sp. Red69]|uniref:Tetratricopeptide repeat protein n=1 Tax=Geomonas diazotrophica TaxID=2843197 RepID=A0ABX8JKT9_9BACT|nr:MULTISPECIES: hypothetical protein [Geomonas]MBU5638394.1 hypothetical protein [Geomonas diazotrophica]QWV97272.1 hypothetical protein KP005_18305 [Geomonas nitrogeniifigens]QXE86443.1 hypothetical protein KP003_19110 [Geomonas nitrogeniifigens]
MEKVKTIAVNVAAIAVISVALFWGNALYRQYAQFEKGEKGTASGDFPAAVAGYEAAIHMYTPGSSIVPRSAQKLWDLGQMAEANHDTARALVAYRALRSSFYAVASIYSPGQEWIQRCDARIAALVAQQGR